LKVSSKLLLQKVVKVDALSLPPLAGLGGVTIKTLLMSDILKKREEEGEERVDDVLLVY